MRGQGVRHHHGGDVVADGMRCSPRGLYPECGRWRSGSGCRHRFGLDDTLALLFLASRPDIQIRAVTVVGDGLVHCDAGVRNARSLLTFTGHGDVPVACGGRQPSLGVNAFPDEWRDAADDLYGLDLATPQADVDGTLTASELLIQALDGTTILAALGPLTNVADALHEDPGLADRVPTVVSMAGAVDVEGNAPNRVAEYNVWVDSLAAKDVMSAMRVTLVPLDATNAAPITRFFVDALMRHRGTPAAEAAYDLVANDPFLVSGQYFFWDPLAAGLLAEPALGTYRNRRLLVTASQDSGAGWIEPYAHGVDVRVTTHADALGFEGRFLSALAGERVTDIRPDADIEVTFDGDACSLPKRTASLALQPPPWCSQSIESPSDTRGRKVRRNDDLPRPLGLRRPARVTHHRRASRLPIPWERSRLHRATMPGSLSASRAGTSPLPAPWRRARRYACGLEAGSRHLKGEGRSLDGLQRDRSPTWNGSQDPCRGLRRAESSHQRERCGAGCSRRGTRR